MSMQENNDRSPHYPPQPAFLSQEQERKAGMREGSGSPEFPPASSEEAPPPPPPQTIAVKMPDTKPVVVYVLMGISIIIYLLQYGSQALLGVDYPGAFGLKVNDLIMQGQYWRLITPMLLHGSPLHLVFNMYALYIFGPNLEKTMGHARFLALYLIAGLGGNVVSFMLSAKASLGASTSIFGLLAAEGIFLYQNKKIFGKNAQRALVNIITVAVINLVIGMSPGIDNWGHVGGLLGGMAFSWFAGPILHVEGVFPSLKLVDGREPGDIWRAGILVSVVMIGLVAGVIYLRGG